MVMLWGYGGVVMIDTAYVMVIGTTKLCCGVMMTTTLCICYGGVMLTTTLLDVMMLCYD